MTDDLRHRLAALTREPVPGENDLPLPLLQSRVRRGRTVRTGGIGAVAAVTVLGAALVAQALPGQDPGPSLPAVTATPTPEPSRPSEPEPSRPSEPEPTAPSVPTSQPTQTPAPTPEPTAAPDAQPTDTPLVGLTDAGELVRLDPATGETLQVLAHDPAFGGGSLTVHPDGRTAYVVSRTDPDRFAWPTIVQVSLLDGATRTVGRGYGPALSPDGTTLAYVGPPDETSTDIFDGRGLVLLHVATGGRRYVPDNDTGLPDFMRWLGSPTWAADGAHILLGTGWANEMGPSSGSLSVIDPSAPPATLVSAPRIDAEGEAEVGGLFRMREFSDAWALPDGGVAAEEFESTTPAGTQREDPTWRTALNLVVLRDGAVERRIPVPVQVDDGLPERVFVASLTPRSGATDLVLTITLENWETGARKSSLWAWDGRDILRELRSGIAAVDS